SGIWTTWADPQPHVVSNNRTQSGENVLDDARGARLASALSEANPDGCLLEGRGAHPPTDSHGRSSSSSPSGTDALSDGDRSSSSFASESRCLRGIDRAWPRGIGL